MVKRVLFFIFTCLSFAVQAQSLQLSESERIEVRQTNLEIAKQTCIFFWTDTSSKMQLLFDIGVSLDDQCRCTQDSASYLVSDDLAAYASHALYEIRTNGMENLSPTLEAKLDEHTKIIMTAMQGCTRKLKRQR
jgi:hypothetical protein